MERRNGREGRRTRKMKKEGKGKFSTASSFH